MMDVYSNAISKNEKIFISVSLNEMADEIEDLFPFQANSIRNIAKRLAASNN